MTNIITKNIEVPTFRLTKEELNNFVNDLELMIRSANHSKNSIYTKYKIEINTGKELNSFDNWSEIKTFDKNPEAIKDLELIFYENEEAPISSVRINFSHSRRTIQVQGTDKNQIEAITTVSEKKLIEHETNLGGFKGSLVLFFMFIVAISIFWNIHGKVKNKTKKYIFTILPISLYLAWIYYQNSSYTFFPGFDVTSNDYSFFTSKTVIILGFISTCIGLLLGIVAILNYFTKDEL